MPLATLLQEAIGPEYILEQELEGGAMSRVFIATELRHNRRVVVKALSPDLISPARTIRFKREIELTVRLQHPLILPVLTSGAYQDLLYYIAPFITGESLKDRIARDGKLPVGDIVRILRDTAEVLAFAHGQGVVHRDVKPGNILLADGHAILADFGIARALMPDGTPLTASGVFIGTPAYMAPELPTDQSADVFALGVVAYEMLCGSLPSGIVTAKAIRAARGNVSAEPGRSVQALAELAARTLSRSPGVRPPSAAAFLEQLNDIDRSGLRQRAMVVTAAAITIPLVALGWVAAKTPVRGHANLSSSRYVITTLGSGDFLSRDIARLVEERFSEWRGITVVAADPARNESSDKPPTVNEELEAARALGARNMVIVGAVPRGDSETVQGTLYDVGGDSVVRQSHAMIATTRSDTSGVTVLRRFVNSLVRTGDELPWHSASDRSAPSLAAWQQYDAGRAAVRTWNLEEAQRAFRNATTIDPTFSLAHLWTAQTLDWSNPERREEGRAEAARALVGRPSLAVRDSVRAIGFELLFDGEYPSACGAFETLAQIDPTDYTAWIGYGECQARDPVVVPDQRTFTHRAFRSSFENAARAYTRAATLADATPESPFRGWILGRLARVLYPTTNRLRLGFAIQRDTAFMGALPFLDSDTVAFAPHPMRDFATRTADPPPALVQAAASRARGRLRVAAEDWVRVAPRDPGALDSLATWSELSGGFALVNDRQMPTLDLVREARRLAADPTEQLRLAISEVRLLVKEEQFGAARQLDDSLLNAGALNRNSDVEGVIGLAALAGRAHTAAQLLPLARVEHRIGLPNGASWSPPRPVEVPAAALLTYAVFGAYRDSVVVLARRVSERISRYVPDTTEAGAIRSVLVAGAFGYGDAKDAIVAGFQFQPPDGVVRAVLDLSRGDTASARNHLQQLKEIDRGKLPGNGVRLAFRAAIAWLALRDTAEAVRQLDDIVHTLPSLDIAFLSEVANIGSLVRAFALRAELAARAGDLEGAQKNARAVVALWGNADTELQPLVRRMREIASGRRQPINQPQGVE